MDPNKLECFQVPPCSDAVMTTYAITITNPGAETGTMSGWTDTGHGMSVTNSFPHSGTYHFKSDAGFNQGAAGMYQIINFDAARYAQIDAYELQLFVSGWHRCPDGQDFGWIKFIVYDDVNGTGTVLQTVQSSNHTGSAYAQLIINQEVSPGARSMRLEVSATNGNFNLNTNNYWDDIDAYFDDTQTTQANAYQLGVYHVSSQVTDEAEVRQLGVHTVEAAETSNGLYDIKIHQLGVYVLVRGQTEHRRLHAWTYTLDGHDYYVLNLNDIETLVWDKLTDTWSKWKSADKPYWRPMNGLNWNKELVAGDRLNNMLYDIDADSRMDGENENEVPIESVLIGALNLRLMESLPCNGVRLTVSQGFPTTTGVGIRLEVSDDDGYNFTDCGLLVLDTASKFDYDISWRSLGTMRAPGRVFRITDTGYAHRIDALDMEDPPGMPDVGQ